MYLQVSLLSAFLSPILLNLHKNPVGEVLSFFSPILQIMISGAKKA